MSPAIANDASDITLERPAPPVDTWSQTTSPSPPPRHRQVELTPEEERVCDRATD